MEAPNQISRDLALAMEAIDHDCFIRFDLVESDDVSESRGVVVPTQELKPLHEVIEHLRVTLRHWDLQSADRCFIRDGQAMLPVYSGQWLDTTMDSSQAPPISSQAWAEVKAHLVDHGRSLTQRKLVLEAANAETSDRPSNPEEPVPTDAQESSDTDPVPDRDDSREATDSGATQEAIEAAQLAKGQDRVFRALLRFRSKGGSVSAPSEKPEVFTDLNPPDGVHLNTMRPPGKAVFRITGQITGIETTHNAVIVDGKYLVELPRCSALSREEQLSLIGQSFDRAVQGLGRILALPLFVAEEDLFEGADAERD